MPSSNLSSQLILDILGNEDATLENFLILPSLSEIVSILLKRVDGADQQFVWLYGSNCSGKSHLLQASCDQVISGSQYLPLRQLLSYPAADVLNDLSSLDLIALDDVHLIIGNDDWEHAIFDTFNDAYSKGCRIVFSADRPAPSLDVRLCDLKSRFSSSISYHLPNFSDREKAKILSFRASRLGLNLVNDVANFLVNRADRDLHNLIALLKTLDKASLKNSRPLTIPFVKEVLGW